MRLPWVRGPAREGRAGDPAVVTAASDYITHARRVVTRIVTSQAIVHALYHVHHGYFRFTRTAAWRTRERRPCNPCPDGARIPWTKQKSP